MFPSFLNPLPTTFRYDPKERITTRHSRKMPLNLAWIGRMFPNWRTSWVFLPPCYTASVRSTRKKEMAASPVTGFASRVETPIGSPILKSA